MFSETLMARALSTLAISLSESIPIYSCKRFLSIVRICSSKIIESLLRPSKSLIAVWVGSFAFVCTRLVIAATITVGLCLFPISLEMISTGRVSRSERKNKSANQDKKIGVPLFLMIRPHD